MNELTVFQNDQFGQVRTIRKENDLWFVAVDVCQALDIANSRDALNRLDEDEKGVALTDTLGGEQELSTVNEAGLYTLIMRSRKKEAKQFRRWVTHEVLPAIRKQGYYMTPAKAAARKDAFERLREARDARSEHSRWMKQQGIRITPIRAREEDKPC